MHLNTRYNTVEEAYGHRNGLIISAMLVQVTPQENLAVKPFIDSLHNARYKGDITSITASHNFESLLPGKVHMSFN